MKVPISWLKDFVDIDLPVEDLARILTLAGLEVEEILYVGLSPQAEGRHEFKSHGLAWDPEKIVTAEVREVMPHPNADRLVLCDLYDGRQQHTVLTGAPNLFPYKGAGRLPKPLKVAYAREGARIYDGHQPGQVETVLKRAKIRGVESYSMICSEKELGISDEHEGVILLDDDAPVGVPLADYMGDVVLTIEVPPNMARALSIFGVAREVAALTGKPLRKPDLKLKTAGESIEGRVSIRIEDPALNPRFMLALIRNVTIGPSPYFVQRRLRLAGLRPINNVVDATNYAMLELGEPLHAFDYDALVARAGRRSVRILTRAAKPGEKLTTLDGVERTLDPINILVCDAQGPLSLAGVMGGAETEVTGQTRNVLLEAASWNFIHIRRTADMHDLRSEASYRFSRGVHPALAADGLRRGLQWMARWAGGQIAPGIVDEYPAPVKDPVVRVTTADVQRLLGITLSAQEIADLLGRLEFKCTVSGESLRVRTPPFRLDIGEGVIGVADIVEEIARLYGYDRIPAHPLADSLPPQRDNPLLAWQELLRDRLVALGLQEVITPRMTSPEREARLGVTGEYVRLANPIAPERSVMRRSLLASVLDALERNARLRPSLALFELGPVYEPRGNDLPDEPLRLALALTGLRDLPAWDRPAGPRLDFFDLKGLLEALFADLRLLTVTYEPAEHPAFHPGKCARVLVDGREVGVFGELHPAVQARYDFGPAPVLAAEFDADVLRALPPVLTTEPVPAFPPVLEDIAVIVDETVPAARVEALIRQTGGRLLAAVRLFDVFRGEQIGAGKKSLAYSLTYQAPDRTLTDEEAAALRNKIIRRLQQELGAQLRG